MDRPLRSLLTGSGPIAAFLRYVVVGGSNGLLSSVGVTLLGLAIPFAVANALITIASTILGTHLHARFTFTARGAAGPRQHLQAAATAAAAYALTSAAMLALPLVCADPSIWIEQIAYLTASAVAGVLRFVVLRVLVFNGTTSTTWLQVTKPTARSRPLGFPGATAFAANPA
ncbi:GtrA family protein [Nocardia goodfellowii]|uniref:Flippase GtrA n=1 Tax=Nocardia goodfellowii TaxID=882446 RepID=A0ABS4Q8L6_9NOCA|nr:GtrA family protein [Nocardia goodfellowii]MBP2187434.1 putative flippase GtrA [Nocardia goodfellowii]